MFAEVRMRTRRGLRRRGREHHRRQARAAARRRAALPHAPARTALPLRCLPGRWRASPRAMDPRRVWRVALRAVLALRGAQAQDADGVRLLVQSSPLAGFRYHAAAEVWHELRVGDRSSWCASRTIRTTPNAVQRRMARPQARLRAAARERGAGLGPRSRHAAARAHQPARAHPEPGAAHRVRGVRMTSKIAAMSDRRRSARARAASRRISPKAPGSSWKRRRR